jgi:hypothetical protein
MGGGEPCSGDSGTIHNESVFGTIASNFVPGHEFGGGGEGGKYRGELRMDRRGGGGGGHRVDESADHITPPSKGHCFRFFGTRKRSPRFRKEPDVCMWVQGQQGRKQVNWRRGQSSSCFCLCFK